MKLERSHSGRCFSGVVYAAEMSLANAQNRELNVVFFERRDLLDAEIKVNIPLEICDRCKVNEYKSTNMNH